MIDAKIEAGQINLLLRQGVALLTYWQGWYSPDESGLHFAPIAIHYRPITQDVVICSSDLFVTHEAACNADPDGEWCNDGERVFGSLSTGIMKLVEALGGKQP